jgi:TetR/AcrR family transcriptional repressor of nem operon
MARPLEFDRAAALDAALQLFWGRGYQATSLSDLVVAMGISRSSFYAAFGDKAELFRECLDLFAARSIGLLSRARAERPPLDALRSFFTYSLDQAEGVERAYGCLIVSSVLELAGVDEDLWAHARLRLAEVEAAFEACLADTGCGPQRATELASFLMLLNEGMRVSARRALPEAAQRHQIDTTFQLLATALA